MPTPKPKPMKTPFEQRETQTNTFAPFSIADTPEAQAFLDVPIDADPGVGRRTDLAEQEAENRANSVFGGGVPQFFRQQALASEKRGIRAQGAAEAREAEVARNRMELERRRVLLPQILQTGGSGFSSGFGTQIVQPQPGFLHKAGLAAIGGLSSGIRFGAGG